MGCLNTKLSFTNSILPSNNSPTIEENQKEVFNEKSEQNLQLFKIQLFYKIVILKKKIHKT